MYDDIVRLDFYAGSDGPTLRVDVRSERRMREVIAGFHSLTSPSSEPFCIHRLSDVKLFTPLELTCRAITDYTDLKALYLHRKDGCYQFTWAVRPHEWREHAATLDGLIAAGYPCHAYLNLDVGDDAILEFTCLEIGGKE